MSEPKRVAVNIVAWNALPYMQPLLASLDAQTYQDFSVTMIDNASTDGASQWLQQDRPDVYVLRNFRNQGVCRGQNQALALAASRWPEEAWTDRYVLVAHPDIELDPTALEQLVGFLDEHQEVSACAPLILRSRVVGEGEDGQRVTERTEMIDTAGWSMHRTRRLTKNGAGKKIGEYAIDPKPPFALPSVCMLWRMSAFAALRVGDQAFDDRFFGGLEDVDLCWRAREAGMDLQLVPEARVWHHNRSSHARRRWGAKAEETNPQEVKVRNTLWLFTKNDAMANLFFHAPWVIFAGCVGFFRLVLGPVRRGFFRAVGGWFGMRRDRAAWHALAQVKPPLMRNWFV